MALDRELQAAQKAARAAAALARRLQLQGLTAETKSDESPVTLADRECERLITDMLAAEFPDDGVLGEEGAAGASRSGRRWILDPIDGTRDFVRANRNWAVLIGLEEGDDVLAGVCYLPMYDEMYAAARGLGASCNGRPLRASAITTLDQAVVCINGLNGIHRTRLAASAWSWLGGCWAVRSLGGAPDAMMVVSGQADIWIEIKAAPWDLAPMKVLAEEAGVRFLNFDGRSSIHGGDCILCVPALEEQVFRFLHAAAATA
jgi:fructose-1,6-bisphosphatase/inositol monophosphatase family enzyme